MKDILWPTSFHILLFCWTKNCLHNKCWGETEFFPRPLSVKTVQYFQECSFFCSGRANSGKYYTALSKFSVQVIIRFRVKFGIHLHECAFWKTHKCKLIPNWTRKPYDYLITLKKIAWRIFLEAICSHSREHFSKFLHKIKFSSLFYKISFAYKISYCLSANHNPELRCVICTGVTLFALVLHFLHCCST